MGSEFKIVVYCAHLAIENSVINRAIRDAMSDLAQVNFHDLYELYPDFFTNTATEQAVLMHAVQSATGVAWRPQAAIDKADMQKSPTRIYLRRSTQYYKKANV